MKSTEKRTWSSVKVKLSLIDPTPNNYKIKTDLGKERLQTSLKKFGLAGNIVVNPIGKRYTIIDGNSRLIEEKEKGSTMVWVSIPSKPFSPKEFKEMSAMFDFAKAGNVDEERIMKEVMTHEQMYKEWAMEVPMALLESLGSNAHKAKVEEYPDKVKKKGSDIVNTEIHDIRMVQLFFSDKQELEFRKIEEQLKKKFKTTNTTETVFKALKSIK